jgi:hypothetical protein
LADFKVLQGLVGETNLFTRAEENETLELGMRFQETEKHIKFLVALNDHVIVE